MSTVDEHYDRGSWPLDVTYAVTPELLVLMTPPGANDTAHVRATHVLTFHANGPGRYMAIPVNCAPELHEAYAKIMYSNCGYSFCRELTVQLDKRMVPAVHTVLPKVPTQSDVTHVVSELLDSVNKGGQR